MRYITADYIFPISSPPLANGVVVVDDNGTIEDVLPTPYSPPKDGSAVVDLLPTSLETYHGILCPGFINAHCHLELSHLKGTVSEGKGLTQFIREIVLKRSASKEVIAEAIANSEHEMIANGIVGVGDICNSNHTFYQKAKGQLRYHNFIELFDLDADRADDVFKKGKELAKELADHPTPHSLLPPPYSLTPHASYTVSPRLFKLIKNYADANNTFLSIHNRETASENEMFLSGKGELMETMKAMIPAYRSWKATGKSSLSNILEYLPGLNKLLLVHNTYTTKADIDFANSKLIYWCFCPNANLYIENRLPDFQLFIDAGCKITVGTDSYASNWSLSVLDELKTIHKHAPFIPLETLLQWVTLNGAEFFGWDKELGSIERGKKPGLNLIEHVDLIKMHLTPKSSVRKII